MFLCGLLGRTGLEMYSLHKERCKCCGTFSEYSEEMSEWWTSTEAEEAGAGSQCENPPVSDSQDLAYWVSPKSQPHSVWTGKEVGGVWGRPLGQVEEVTRPCFSHY